MRERTEFQFSIEGGIPPRILRIILLQSGTVEARRRKDVAQESSSAECEPLAVEDSRSLHFRSLPPSLRMELSSDVGTGNVPDYVETSSNISYLLLTR